MDAGPLLATPPPAQTQVAEPRNGAGADRDDFAAQLASETDRSAQKPRNAAEDDAADDDKSDDKKPEATPAPISLIVPLQSVLVRTDGAQPVQEIAIDGVSGAGPGGAPVNADSANAQQAAAAQTPATAETGKADGKSAAGQEDKGAKPERAARAHGAAPESAAAAQTGAKASESGPGKAEPAALQPASAMAREAAKVADAPPPPAAPFADATSATPARLTEAQVPVTHRPPTLAATVAQQVIRRFNGDSASLEIRLDPPELGRVNVRLDVGADSRVMAVVAADNPATLSDLMRNARELERALESAGLDIASGGLSFDLSGQSPDQRSDTTQETAQDLRGRNPAPANSNTPATPAVRPFGLETWRGVRVDVTV